MRARPHPEVANCGGFGRELDVFVPGAPEQLYQQGSGNVEALIHGRVHAGVVFHLLTRHSAQCPSHPTGSEEEERQYGNRQQCEPPFEACHHRDRGHRGEQVGGNGDEGAGHRLLGSDHVVVEPRHQLPGAGGGEEGKRHPLQMAEQLAAEVKDDPLTCRCRRPSLGDAERPVDQGDRHHGKAQPGDTSNIAVGNGTVDEVL